MGTQLLLQVQLHSPFFLSQFPSFFILFNLRPERKKNREKKSLTQKIKKNKGIWYWYCLLSTNRFGKLFRALPVKIGELVWSENLLLCDFTPPSFCNSPPPFVLRPLRCLPSLTFAFCVAFVVRPCWILSIRVRGGIAQKVSIFYKFVAVLQLLLVLLVFSTLCDTPLAGIFMVSALIQTPSLLGLLGSIYAFACLYLLH